jgi:ADP-heptose:LPS heptosyltransferase
MSKKSRENNRKRKEKKMHKNNLRIVKEHEIPRFNTNNILILRNGQSPGDGVMLAFAITSLMQAYPGKFIVEVETPYNELFQGLYASGMIRHLTEGEREVAQVLEIGYETIHKSNQYPYFYMTGMLYDLEEKLGITIPPAEYSGFVTLEEVETHWFSAPREILGKDVPYWILNAGWKDDYTAKQWSTSEYQRLVDMFPNEYFVQIGHTDHNHPELAGDNLINLVGKTDLRQLIRLIWSSYGVITPCSMAMLLSYAIPPHPRYRSKSRACIAITGGREPNHWHQGPNMQYVHTCGMLPCCDYGGCWKSRVIRLEDGEVHDDSLCEYPITLPDGQVVAKCMTMIKAEDVARHMENYINNRAYFEEPTK